MDKCYYDKHTCNKPKYKMKTKCGMNGLLVCKKCAKDLFQSGTFEPNEFVEIKHKKVKK